MKKFQFLLLDTGPILKLFELGIWDTFLQKCHVVVTRTVANDEVVYTGEGDDKEYIDYGLEPWEKKGLIEIVDVDILAVKKLYEKYELAHRFPIDPGEEATLAFIESCTEDFGLCAADRAAFRALAYMGKAEQGISLEEILREIGLSYKLEWKFTKKFRDKFTALGKADYIQGQGLE